MKRISLLIFTFTILLTLLLTFSGCNCKHNWADATCITPQTCLSCGKTQGNADGQHIPGQVQQTCDYINCQLISESRCTICNTIIRTRNIPIDSFIEDDLYILTPRMFLERMSVVADTQNTSFSYFFTDTPNVLQAEITYGNLSSLVQFYASDTTPLGSNDADSSNLWCVSIGQMGLEEDAGFLISEELYSLFFLTCDPLMSSSDIENLKLVKLCCALNAIEYSEPFGYQELNGILYEFGHSPSKKHPQYYIETIQAYASSW